MAFFQTASGALFDNVKFANVAVNHQRENIGGALEAWMEKHPNTDIIEWKPVVTDDYINVIIMYQERK